MRATLMGQVKDMVNSRGQINNTSNGKLGRKGKKEGSQVERKKGEKLVVQLFPYLEFWTGYKHSLDLISINIRFIIKLSHYFVP